MFDSGIPFTPRLVFAPLGFLVSPRLCLLLLYAVVALFVVLVGLLQSNSRQFCPPKYFFLLFVFHLLNVLLRRICGIWAFLIHLTLDVRLFIQLRQGLQFLKLSSLKSFYQHISILQELPQRVIKPVWRQVQYFFSYELFDV